MGRSPLLLIFLFQYITANSQSELHCITQYSNPVGSGYSEIDLNNDTIFQHSSVLGLTITQYMSATTDPVNNIYYVSNGTHIFGFDVSTDSLISQDSVQISNGILFSGLAYNPCDSLIYGVAFPTGTGTPFWGGYSYDPTTGQFDFVAPLPAGYYKDYLQGSIDPVANEYKFVARTYFSQAGYCYLSYLISGSPVGYAPLSLGLFETISNTVFDCVSSRLVCIVNGVSGTYLAWIDENTGSIIQISASTWNTGGIYVAGGCTIDHTTGTFYYMPLTAGIAIVNEIDLTTGNFFASHITDSSQAFCIQHMSACNCYPLSISEQQRGASVKLYPNPANDYITLSVEVEPRSNCEYTISDIAGREVASTKMRNNEEQISVCDLLEGYYIISIVVDGEIIIRKRLEIIR